MTSKELVDSFRAVADFYEKNPDFPIPYIFQLDAFVREKSELIKCAHILGNCHKEYSYGYFTLKKTFGSINLLVNASRDKVCQRRVVGKKMIEREVPILTEKRMVEEDIVEWDCKDASLLENKETELLTEETIKTLGE